MPQIPTVVSGSTNQAGGLDRSFSSVSASPNDFGANVGSALEGVGNQLSATVATVDAKREEEEAAKRKERVVLAVAQRPLTPILNDAMTNAPPDGQGTYATVVDKSRNQINADSEALFAQDPKAGREFRLQQYGKLASVGERAITFEKTQSDNYSRDQTNTALNSVFNGLRQDPTSYDAAVKQGTEIIDASTAVDSSTKLSFKSQFMQHAANTRFEGLLGSAKTVDDLNAINAQLKDHKWQAALNPKDFESIGKTITNQKIVIQNKFDAETGSALKEATEYSHDMQNPVMPAARLQELQSRLKAAGSTASTANATQFSKLITNEKLKAQTNGLPPQEIYKLADQARGGASYPGMPPVVSEAITKASQMFPNVSPALLGATIQREYGGNLKSGDYTIKAETSSAKGLMQFTDGTWDATANSPTGRMALKQAGYDTATMTPAQVRALRDDPVAATIAGAALASQNKNTLEDNLKRPVTDAEVYMAHFLGSGGATTLLKAYSSNGEASAAALLPQAAAANRNVFYDREGNPKSVRQLYDGITAGIEGSPSQGQAYAAQRYKAIGDNTAKALETNPVGFVARSTPVPPLESPDSWRARGTLFSAVGQQYDIASGENKPFNTDTELAGLSQKIKDGTSEETLALLKNMSEMDKAGPGALASGLDQLGIKNSSYGIAAALMTGEQTDAATAGAVVRGTKRIDADASVKEYTKAADVTAAFDKTVGTALYGVPPATRAAIREAAIAHYVETTGTLNPTSFDKTAFAKSINAVSGGGKEQRIDDVNGYQTMLPKGVKGDDFNNAVDNLKADDLIATSVDLKGRQVGSPPMYVTGEVVSPIAIATQGQLQYVGNDMYQVRMADNKTLVRKETDATTGFPLPYLMRMDKKTVDNLRSRKTAAYDVPATPMVP